MALSLPAMAADIKLDWDGDAPFVVSIIQTNYVYEFKTLNNLEVVKVDGRYCTAYKVCNVSGCTESPRVRVSNRQIVVCK